jgi:hypothetical protein
MHGENVRRAIRHTHRLEKLTEPRKRRNRYNGAITVADLGKKRLRAIRKWKNVTLRYQVRCYWYHTCPMLRRSAEACRAPAAGHSLCGCSSCVSDRGSVRCELWSQVVDSSRTETENCLHAIHPCPLLQIARVCVKAITQRQLSRAVRCWRDGLSTERCFSVEELRDESARFQLGLAGAVSMTLSEFNNLNQPAAPDLGVHPMPGARLSPRLEAADMEFSPPQT